MTTQAQLAASNPHVSAFVSAHAGTGKTKLLIDRLVRLMLAGADPARILCLTFTKAAAAEMAIRLQSRLGAWVAMPDAALDAQLTELDVIPSAARRLAARALFARVLDLPGGMRIGTIHAFCQSLLKRFPLEAAISPHFQLVETSDARAQLEQARESVLPQANPATLAALAGLVGADGFADLVKTLEASRHRLQPALALPPDALRAALRRAAGATRPDEAAILADAVAWPDEAPLRLQIDLAARHGSPSIKTRAENMLAWLGLPPDHRAEHWPQWIDLFFTKEAKPRGLTVFANEKLSKIHPGIIPACEAEQARIEAVQDSLRALRMADATAALLTLAAPILDSYAHAKDRRALLDYDDLIGRTASLLEQQGAAWVLFKLDGGLDHLLLDEVQDTAPTQWTIADRLTADFFTGEGAQEATTLPRTVFAVGAGVEQAAKAGGHPVEVPFTPGRTDATQAQTDVDAFAVLEPQMDGFRNYAGNGRGRHEEVHLVDRAHLLGLSAPEMTVLVGGMRVMDTNFGHTDLGVFTARPGQLTNDFFVNLLDMSTTWKALSQSDDRFEGTDRRTGAPKWQGTRVDLVFGSNSLLRAVAEVFGCDDTHRAFVDDFVLVWTKVMNADRYDLA